MKKTLLFVFSAIALQMHAGPRTLAQMQGLAAQFSNLRETKQWNVVDNRSRLSVLEAPNGTTVIVTNDDRLPAVLGIVDTSVSQTSLNAERKNTEFEWYLDAANAAMEHALKTGKMPLRIAPDPTRFPTNVPNMIFTRWSQDEPYKNHTPKMTNGDNYVTGCVATSMAQVLAYHRLPMRGIGQAQLTSPLGEVMTADFGHTLYDWDNMKQSYNYIEKDYTFEEGEAVATLMAHCGVAVNMNYGEGGSGTTHDICADGLRNYFGFSTARFVKRENYAIESWMDMIFDELSHRAPIIYGGISSYGHSFVFSGYREDGFVYVNWGWGGDKNGWFDVNVLDPDNNGGFTSGQTMVVGMRSYQPDVWEQTVTTTAGGQLTSLLNSNVTYGEIKVVGPINSDDLRCLRQRVNSQTRTGYPNAADTYSLDLSEARLVVGGEPFLTEGKNQYSITAADELPAMAFNGCTNLRYLKLPQSLKAIGNGAFGGCMALTNLEGHGDDYVCEGNFVYNGDRTRLIAVMADMRDTLVVPEGVTAIGDYALSSLYAVSVVDMPSTLTDIGTAVFATGEQQLRAVIMRSEKAPTAADRNVFNIIGPKTDLYVHAAYERNYQTSTAYKQFRSIQLFGSVVTATGALREYGDENPTFGYSTKGDPVVGEPAFTTEANINSPAGTYAIIPTQGTITTPDVVFVEGKLVVQKAPLTARANDFVRYEGQQNPTFTISYEGLKNSDAADILTVQPTASTTATAQSSPGSYPITVSGGESDRYELTYVDGTLTILPSDGTGIDEFENSPVNGHALIYDLQGRRVNTNSQPLPHGIYVKDHRKIVVKK